MALNAHSKISTTSLLPRTLYNRYHILWLHLLSLFCIQMLLYCLGCLPDDTRTIASHLYPCLLFYPPICPPYCCQNSIRTTNLWPWYFLPGTYPFSSTFGMLLNLPDPDKVSRWVIWPWPICPIILHCPTLQQSYSFSFDCFAISYLCGKYYILLQSSLPLRSLPLLSW